MGRFCQHRSAGGDISRIGPRTGFDRRNVPRRGNFPGHPLRTLVRSLSLFQNVEEQILEPLTLSDVAELVTRVERLSGSSDELARTLFAHSEGNALFLNEIVHNLIDDGGSLSAAPGASIQSMLDARIDRLDSQARTIAEIAAIAGPGCTVALVRAVSICLRRL